jgi:hypothetical protein
MKYSNPRLVAEFNDWPIGGTHRGQCKFEVEPAKPGKGVRISRTTTDKYGRWCKPKVTTYGGPAAIVDGADGKTYVLQMRMGNTVCIWEHSLQYTTYIRAGDPEFAELKTLIEQANQPTEEQPAPVLSSTDNAKTEREIKSAFRDQFGMGNRIQTNFEHGQWWITDLDTGAQWSVVDSSDGFDFEEVTPAEEV